MKKEIHILIALFLLCIQTIFYAQDNSTCESLQHIIAEYDTYQKKQEDSMWSDVSTAALQEKQEIFQDT